jgi:hypothetical protein
MRTHALKNWFERHPKSTLAVVLLLVFILLDLTLGFFCPKVVGTPDAYYHHDLPRNFSGVKPWGNRKYRVFTNSLGFIDRSPREVPLTSNNRRILLLGDSFTEGVGVEFDDTFAGVLASRLAPQGVEVLNAAVTSYSPKLYYLKTRYLLRNVGLKFDELIVFIDISDIQDEILHDEFEPADDFGFSRYYLVNRIDSFLRQHSLSWYFARSRLGRAAPAAKRPAAGVDMDSFVANWDRDRGRWTVDETIYRLWGEKGLELAGYHMELLARLCAENHIRLTIAVYPWPIQIQAGELDSIQARFWRRFCEERGIGFLDLFPAFIDNALPERVVADYFIPGDNHWNAAGHRLVADVLFQRWAAGR